MENLWIFIPEYKIIESIDFSTEILQTNLKEQRISLRQYPRTTMEFSHFLYPNMIELATRRAKNYLGSKIFVPFWQDKRIVSSISASQSSISIETDDNRFISGQYLLIIDGLNNYETVEIASVGSGVVNLVSPYVQGSYSNALVVPVNEGLVSSPLSIDKNSGESVLSKIKFSFDQDFGISSSNTYPSFDGKFVLNDCNIVGGGQESLDLPFGLFDSVSGPLTPLKDRKYTSYTETIKKNTKTTNSWVVRRWLNHVKGKAKSFFAPTWTHDFSLSSNALQNDTEVYVDKGEFSSSLYSGYIYIKRNDGTEEFNEVISSESFDSTTDRLNLLYGLSQDLNISDIQIFSRMNKVRLNSDSISLIFERQRLEYSMPIIEVPE